MKTRADVALLMDKIFRECQDTRESGQKEYAHDESNALANFERAGLDLGILREKVWFIFAKKHWDGVLAWINGHRSQREDVRGRIKDMIVYLVLLWVMIEDDEEQLQAVNTSFPKATDKIPNWGDDCCGIMFDEPPHPQCRWPRDHKGKHSWQL